MIDYIAETRINYRAVVSKISSANDIFKELEEYADKQQEHFIVSYLNGANEVIENRIITIGILNQSLVHPREVFAPAIANRSSAIILAHNHPSGVLEASAEDIGVTKRLKEAGRILGIEVLDHLILTKNGFLSFKAEDLL